jgi:hypothetical protein
MKPTYVDYYMTRANSWICEYLDYTVIAQSAVGVSPVGVTLRNSFASRFEPLTNIHSLVWAHVSGPW